MSYYYREGGSWKSPTLKRREGGQWVTISTSGGGTGGGGDLDFDWQNPPSRSSTIYSSDYSDLQTAVNDLSSDEELIIDDGPYTEDFSLPATPHITVSGGDGDPATINIPTDGEQIISGPFDSMSDILGSGTNASAISRGATTVSVDDPSIFSEGDEIFINDPDDDYWGVGAGTSTGDGSTSAMGPPTAELNVVASVGSSSIEVERGVLDNYNDANGNLSVSLVEWGLYDVHITNLDLHGYDTGDKGSNQGVELEYVKNVWMDDMTGGTFRRALLEVESCKNVSMRNSSQTGSQGNYAFRGHGTHHLRAEDLYGENNRHMVNVGAGTDVNPGYDNKFYNCSSSSSSDLYDAHWGAQQVRFEIGPDSVGSDMSISRPRGVRIHTRADTGTDRTYDANGHDVFMFSQKPVECTIENMHIDNCDEVCFVRPDNELVVEDCRTEDVQVTNATGDWFDFSYTGGDVDACNIDNFMVYNCALNGSWVDMDHISSTSGYDSNNMSFDVQHPSDQTPSEYFS